MKERSASRGVQLARVDMRRIKRWAATRLGPDSILRRTLEREHETIPASDFVAKLEVWLQLLEFEENRR